MVPNPLTKVQSYCSWIFVGGGGGEELRWIPADYLREWRPGEEGWLWKNWHDVFRLRNEWTLSGCCRCLLDRNKGFPAFLNVLFDLAGKGLFGQAQFIGFLAVHPEYEYEYE